MTPDPPEATGTTAAPAPGSLPVGPLPDGLDPESVTAVRRIPFEGTHYWSVGDYDLARTVLSDPRFSREAAVAPGATELTALSPAAESIVSMDGAPHGRLRRLIAGTFTERATARFAGDVGTDVARLLDAMADGEPAADLVGSLCARLPLSVLCRILGIPLRDEDEFRSLVGVLFALDEDRSEARRKGYRLAAYISGLVRRKRADPGPDLLSSLIAARDADDRLTSRELVTLCLALLMAGYETTADQLTLSVLTMLLDRDRWEAACTDPGVVPAQVDELLRLAPSTPLSFTRVATEDVELGDVTVRAGDPLVVFSMGANRCPRAAGSPHLTFGYGAHRCVGAPLARMQLVTAVTGLTTRFPGLRLDEDPADLPWKPLGATRGLTRLRVRW
ncbi:cytochrome P450 [Pseudonocardia sp. ICBG1293]|uniref:cytochrome P450 n=1 Tax=Pseudonocardia sp. ICBG1293 TaxID=2844382 RepID=UPI001CCDEB99|nr:cytochrome P450 [Pseudonocardia sp. ICBG1293]